MFATISGLSALPSTLTRSKRRRGPGGCDFAADPRLAASRVKVFWSPAFALDTLTITALPPALAGTRLRRALPLAAAALARDGAHLLLEDGLVAQLWLLGPPADEAAIGLLLPIDDALPVRLAAALDLWRRMHGRAPERVRLTPQRRRRLVDGLRALDARRAGASYREIARALFGADRVMSGAAWALSPTRATTMRLVADATVLMRGGYRDLLRRGRPAR